MFALILDWLAQVFHWNGAASVVFQSHGATPYDIAPNSSSFAAWLNYFALALFVLAGVLGALQLQRPKLPRLTFFFLITMLAYGVFWVIVGYEFAEYRLAFGQTGPLLFVMCLGVYAGLDLTLWHRLRPVFLALAYASAMLAWYYTVRLLGNHIFRGATPWVEHMQTAFWFGLCALALRKSPRWRDCVPVLIPIGLCIPIAIVSRARSFTLLTVCGLILALTVPLWHQLRSRTVRVLALGLLTTLLLGGGLLLLFLAAPERVLALKERLLEDTRTSQYSQFFQQVPVASLIAGLGPKATYSFDDWPNYEYIDNMFLFILFKFGLPVVLGYCAVVIWPGLRLVIKAETQKQWLLGVLFAFWTLAACGFSIYHNIKVNPQNLAVVLFAGRAVALAKTRKPPFPRYSDPQQLCS